MQNLHSVPAMSKGRKRIILLVAVLLVGGLIWAVTADREPSYQGRSLSQWLQMHDTTSSEAEQEEAAAAIRQIGTNAVPYLVAWIQYEPSSFARKTEHLVARVGIPWSPSRAHNGRAWASIRALVELSCDHDSEVAKHLQVLAESRKPGRLTELRIARLQGDLLRIDPVPAHCREALMLIPNAITNAPPLQ